MSSGKYFSADRSRPEGIVRDAIPDRDAAACLEIYAPFVRDTWVTFEEQVPTVEEFRDRMVSYMATHPWLVFEADGRVVGYTCASKLRPRAAYRWAVEVTIFVAPSHRRTGAGRRLYTELLERLRRQGFQVACAGIALPNEASVGLHRAMGFEPVGVYKRIGWKAGAWHDVGWWQLELSPATDAAPAEPSSPEPSLPEPSSREPSSREPSSREPSSREPSSREPPRSEPSPPRRPVDRTDSGI
jgi:L-amino acid N-acyltransferase YncA